MPIVSRPYGSSANAAITTTTSIAMRLVRPFPATPQAMPSSADTSSSPTCGRQKQFWPLHAASMLYWPMIICPPRTPITVQSALKIIQPSPYHRETRSTMLDTMVSTLLNLVLNRLTRIQPTTPVVGRGGGRGPPLPMSVFVAIRT